MVVGLITYQDFKKWYVPIQWVNIPYNFHQQNYQCRKNYLILQKNTCTCTTESATADIDMIKKRVNYINLVHFENLFNHDQLLFIIVMLPLVTLEIHHFLYFKNFYTQNVLFSSRYMYCSVFSSISIKGYTVIESKMFTYTYDIEYPNLELVSHTIFFKSKLHKTVNIQ